MLIVSKRGEEKPLIANAGVMDTVFTTLRAHGLEKGSQGSTRAQEIEDAKGDELTGSAVAIQGRFFESETQTGYRRLSFFAERGGEMESERRSILCSMIYKL